MSLGSGRVKGDVRAGRAQNNLIHFVTHSLWTNANAYMHNPIGNGCSVFQSGCESIF